MFKKLGFFLFAMGVGASYAIAGGGEPECYAQCSAEYDQCVENRPQSSAVCTRIMSICNKSCEQSNI